MVIRPFSSKKCIIKRINFGKSMSSSPMHLNRQNWPVTNENMTFYGIILTFKNKIYHSLSWGILIFYTNDTNHTNKLNSPKN